MKEKLWRAIEAYRMAGGREEHWRNRDATWLCGLIRQH